jgi:hypothetical protein
MVIVKENRVITVAGSKEGKPGNQCGLNCEALFNGPKGNSKITK